MARGTRGGAFGAVRQSDRQSVSPSLRCGFATGIPLTLALSPQGRGDGTHPSTAGTGTRSTPGTRPWEAALHPDGRAAFKSAKPSTSSSRAGWRFAFRRRNRLLGVRCQSSPALYALSA